MLLTAASNAAASTCSSSESALGATSGLLVGLLTDGTPRGMALLMFAGALCAVIADWFRPRTDDRLNSGRLLNSRP